jgi:hypothetical protein
LTRAEAQNQSKFAERKRRIEKRRLANAARRGADEEDELRNAQREETKRVQAERETTARKQEALEKLREEGGFSSDSDMG